MMTTALSKDDSRVELTQDTHVIMTFREKKKGFEATLTAVGLICNPFSRPTGQSDISA